jgi:5-formyltetrahydrofolate cyclo-ligase
MYNRLEQGFLVPYHVEKESALIVSNLRVPEPDPSTSRKAGMSEIDLILVPGLAFDREGYRLGYGKGYYDRLLAATGSIPTVGIGFQEQMSTGSLPRDAWDVPVKELLLV